MAGNAETILQRLLPIVPLLVRRWHTLLSPYLVTCTFPLPHSDLNGCTLHARRLVSYKFRQHAPLPDFPSPSSYSLYGDWLPVFQFSHMILFIVGLWALLDKESLEAVITVSVMLPKHTNQCVHNWLSVCTAVHRCRGFHHPTGHHSTGTLL